MQFKKITLFIFVILCWYLGSAQVVLTAATNTPPAGYTDSVYVSFGSGVTVPEGGVNVLWDYSILPASTLRIVELSDETDNNSFPEARYGSPGTIAFQIFQSDAVLYVGADAEGIYDIGAIIEETVIPLTPLTGNPEDTFTFVADTVAYEGRVNILEFPMTYPDMLNASRIERTNVTLNIAAFGLVDAPVQSQGMLTEDRSVIGYGQLIIPLEDNSPSPPIDVLLMEIVETRVDSFFLGGMLPPQALLDAFGVSQGMVSTKSFFVFYTPNLSSTVATLDRDGSGAISSVFYRPRAADLVSSTQALSLANFQLSPNPIQRGQSFTLQSDQDLAQGSARLLSLDGRVVSTISLEDNGSNNYEVRVPGQLSAGMYLLQTFDQSGRMFRAEKVILQ